MRYFYRRITQIPWQIAEEHKDYTKCCVYPILSFFKQLLKPHSETVSEKKTFLISRNKNTISYPSVAAARRSRQSNNGWPRWPFHRGYLRFRNCASLRARMLPWYLIQWFSKHAYGIFYPIHKHTTKPKRAGNRSSNWSVREVSRWP